MSIDKLKTKFFTGAWLTDVKHYFTKINEIIDYLNSNGDRSCKTYKVILSTDINNLPYITSNGGSPNTPLINTLGIITYTNTYTGVYEIKSNGLFLLDKTFLIWGNTSPTGIGSLIGLEHIDINTITINTYDITNTNADGILYNTPIEIQVYN